MTEPSATSQAGAGTRKNPRRRPEWAPANDLLAMPQEDDPAGDGHMWSGKGVPADEASEADEAFDTPMHLPTHPTEPSPF